MGFYWSYTLLLESPVLMRSWQQLSEGFFNVTIYSRGTYNATAWDHTQQAKQKVSSFRLFTRCGIIRSYNTVRTSTIVRIEEPLSLNMYARCEFLLTANSAPPRKLSIDIRLLSQGQGCIWEPNCTTTVWSSISNNMLLSEGSHA